MDLYFIRHGQTLSNREMRYLGRTDEPLSPEGMTRVKMAGRFPDVRYVAVSPMLRARQTAELLFPNAKQLVYEDLREMDFGNFEGRKASELADTPAFNAWVSSNCTIPCPGGETVEAFHDRCVRGFEQALTDTLSRKKQQLIFVVHGGVIMKLMESFADPDRPFFDWFLKNCTCYYSRLDPAVWSKQRRFSGYTHLDILPF